MRPRGVPDDTALRAPRGADGGSQWESRNKNGTDVGGGLNITVLMLQWFVIIRVRIWTYQGVTSKAIHLANGVDMLLQSAGSALTLR